MNEGHGKHGPYHRIGEPGGPGCKLTALPITINGPDGMATPAYLLDAGKDATELEMLRSVVQGLGVKWGNDDLGWWATVPRGR
jgi:hypothetical protein